MNKNNFDLDENELLENSEMPQTEYSVYDLDDTQITLEGLKVIED